MAKSKLEYWSGSAWVQAKTIDFGQGTQNALLNLDLEDKLNSPMKANITLTNAARNPFKVVNDDTDADRYGPLTSVFTDFMPIRIIETSTNVILFSGKLYDIKNIYDKQYGNVVKLYARDNLAEIADYPTDDKMVPINVTTSQRRSDLIQLIIRDAASDPLNASLNISSDNINYGDAAKFTASARTFDEADSYTINSLSRQGLKAIYEIANNDPHEDKPNEIANFGYDYYVDSHYTTVASYTAAADLNYFKRGTRTPFQSTVANFKGAWVEYPIASNFTTTGLKKLMFPDYDFNLPKRDLYTGATAAISRNLVTLDDEGNQVATSVNFNLEIELLEGTIAGSNSGVFQWKNKKLVRHGDNVSADSAFAEVLNNAAGNPVGRVQYQSKTSGAGYILISFEPNTLTNVTISDQKKNFNALSGSAVVLTGEDTDATFTFNTTSGRPSKALGLIRPLRISGNDAKHINSMRRRVASALSRAKKSRTNCTVQVLPPPFTYVDSTLASVSSATQIVLNTNVFDYGLRVGMTIAKIDADGKQTAYGYVSAINSSTTVTATLNTGNWSGYSGSVRVYIPIRASHYIYAKNLLANFAGYMFLSGVIYTEGIGSQITQYKGTGVNTVGLPTGLGIDPNAIQSSIESEGGKYPRDVNVPMGGLGWTYRPTSTTDTAAFSPVDRNTISWTGGEFVIGQMKRFKIRAGNSPDLSTDLDGDTGYPYIYKVFFDPDQSPDGSGTYTFSFIKEDVYYPDMDHVIMAVARAAKLSSGRAVIIFDGTGAGMFGGLDAAGEDQFSAALFKKTLQPYTTDVVISAGTSEGANKHQYASSTAGTISFADNTTVTVEDNTSIDLGTTDNIVYYIFFKMVKSDNSETDDFTLVANAEVDRTITYSNATSGSRSLLAICSTGDVSELDEIAIQAFHGKGQNITADVIAANAITADSIKANSLNAFQIVGGLIKTATNTGASGAGAGIKISSVGIEGFSGGTTRVFFLDPSTGKATFGAIAQDNLNVWGSIGGNGKPTDNATVGAIWGTNLSNQPTSLSNINSGESSKLSGIATGATVGATWSSNLAGQPSDSALLNSQLTMTIDAQGAFTLGNGGSATDNRNAELKRRIFRTTDNAANAPTGPYAVGDWWVTSIAHSDLAQRGTNICIVAASSGTNDSHWQRTSPPASVLYTNTVEIDGGNIRANTVTAATLLANFVLANVVVAGSGTYDVIGAGGLNGVAMGVLGNNDAFVIQKAGVDQFRVDTSGNVSIGGTVTIGTIAASAVDSGAQLGTSAHQPGAAETRSGGTVGGLTLAADKMFIGTGTHNNSNTAFYVDDSGNFSLKNKFAWNASTNVLAIDGTVTIGSTSAANIESRANNSVNANFQSTSSILSEADASDVGLDNVPNYSEATMMGKNHTGTLNGMPISTTTSNSIRFSNTGIKAYSGGVLKAEMSAAGAGFIVYGPGGSVANAGLLLHNSAYVSYISAGTSGSDTRYDAAIHEFYNFGGTSSHIRGLRRLSLSETTYTCIIDADSDLDIKTNSAGQDIQILRANSVQMSFLYTYIQSEVDFRPSLDNNQNLGAYDKRWSTLYSQALNTGDIHLSNLNTIDSGNEIDGTKGSWTIQEGSDNLFIINRQTGKKYKFKLEEV